jgi:hypothetical protein
MKITKLNAGISQLKEAIYLFFEQRDPISVHTIAGASSSLLFNLAEIKRTESPVRGNPNVKKDKKKIWISEINKAQNFFKHADHDPDSELEFNPWITEILIFEGCWLVEKITGEMFLEAKFFTLWFSVKYPELLLEGSIKELIEAKLAEGIDINDFKTIRMALDQIKNA